MSATKSAELQLPSVEKAQEVILTRVFNEAFFGKLAAEGYRPANESQAQYLLEIGGRLEAVAVKQASLGSDPYGAALQDLDRAIEARGLGNQDRATKIAMALADDPEIYLATVSLGQAAQGAAV